MLAHVFSQIALRYSNGSFLAVVTSVTYGFLMSTQADTQQTYKFDVKVTLIYL
jgi:hypothetical protein